MTSPTASDQLKALATTSSKRSKTARLKDLMPDIDHAMQSGMPHSEILQILSASGLEMNVSYFDVARRRIKKISFATSCESASTSVSNNSKAEIDNSFEQSSAIPRSMPTGDPATTLCGKNLSIN